MSDAVIQYRNMVYDVDVVDPRKGVRRVELIHHWRLGESRDEFIGRWEQLVQYSQGRISNIDVLVGIMQYLFCQGRGLSNCMITRVGPLRKINSIEATTSLLPG